MNRQTIILLGMGIVIAALLVVMMKNRATPVQATTATKVLVALSNVGAGSFIRSDKDLAWSDWPDSDIPPTFITQQNHKIEEFNGSVARRDITAGEPITSASVVKASEGGFMSAVLSPGMRAVSIAVTTTSGNAGFIFPGDKVDLILTHKIPAGMLASETFLEDLRVLAIDQMLNNPDNKAVIAKTITMEVTPKQAEMINVATSIGTISVSLRSLANTTTTPVSVVMPNAGKGNYSTDNDVSKISTETTPSNKVNVYHGAGTPEQLNFGGGR